MELSRWLQGRIYSRNIIFISSGDPKAKQVQNFFSSTTQTVYKTNEASIISIWCFVSPARIRICICWSPRHDAVAILDHLHPVRNWSDLNHIFKSQIVLVCLTFTVILRTYFLRVLLSLVGPTSYDKYNYGSHLAVCCSCEFFPSIFLFKFTGMLSVEICISCFVKRAFILMYSILSVSTSKLWSLKNRFFRAQR